MLLEYIRNIQIYEAEILFFLNLPAFYLTTTEVHFQLKAKTMEVTKIYQYGNIFYFRKDLTSFYYVATKSQKEGQSNY